MKKLPAGSTLASYTQDDLTFVSMTCTPSCKFKQGVRCTRFNKRLRKYKSDGISSHRYKRPFICMQNSNDIVGSVKT